MTEATRADVDRAEAPTTARRTTHKTLLLFLIAGAQLMVVLDSTIVNIALPSMGRYFDKSQTDMTWAINAYTLAFGGLLLLGGRAADILGRRQMFILGLGLFSLGSLFGGLANSFELLLAGRVVQGIGGAIAAPTALSLITTLFAEGRERNRAFAVYAGVSGGGAAIGLLLGGVLTEYLDWRWVLFVNVPIGLALMAGGFRYIHDSERLSGKFDIVGSLLSVTGMVALVYGFINAANHSWNAGTTIASLGGGVVLLAAFVLYESRSSIAMMPMRIFANRSRAGSYVIMLILGAALFGMFYYLTFFIQGVLGFSSLKSGVAYLPFSLIIIVGSGIVSQILPRVGPRLLLIAGSAFMTAGLFWYSRVDADTSYGSGILPPMIVTATGVALVFVTLTVVAVTKVTDTDTGLASALLNVGQQIGGSIGLAVLATAVSSATKSEGKSELGKLAGASQQHLAELLASAQTGRPAAPAAYADHPALHSVHVVQAHGSSQGFLVAAVLGVVAVIAAAALINIKKTDERRPPRHPSRSLDGRDEGVAGSKPIGVGSASTPSGVLWEEGVAMAKNGVVRARQAMGASLLAVLSVLPYAIIYAIDRGLGVPDAARSALWPTAVVPVLVAAVVAGPFLRSRTSHQAKLAALTQLPRRDTRRHAA